MNIHLPPMFTRATWFWPIPICVYIYNIHVWAYTYIPIKPPAPWPCSASPSPPQVAFRLDCAEQDNGESRGCNLLTLQCNTMCIHTHIITYIYIYIHIITYIYIYIHILDYVSIGQKTCISEIWYNVGSWLVWGYWIVSTDLKIILKLWKWSRVQFCVHRILV